MAFTCRASSALILLGVLCVSGAELETAPEADSISAADLRRDVFVLASDEMGGRLVGTDGNRKAAEFIAGRFKEHGLRAVAVDGSYRQRFDLVIPRIGTDNALAVTIENQADGYALGSDFYPERFSGMGRAAGSVVFVGFGISAPALAHDDYGDTDLSGRIVMVLDHEPDEWDANSVFDGREYTEHARGVRKVLEAQRRGAAAVLMVADVHNHSTSSSLENGMSDTWPRQPPRVPRYELGAWVNEVHIPVFRVSIALAERVLTDGGEPLDTVTRKADAAGGMVPIERPDVVVEVTGAVLRERVQENNVIGLVEGSDPALRHEWIILSAHYDHEGTTSRGIFNGADDDASGIAGLLEISEAYLLAARDGQRPKRSILFAAWNAEERGMLGSWAYAEQPLAPLNQTVAVINMDMIGRSEEVPEDGGIRFRGLEPQTAESNADAVNLLGYSYSDDLRRAAEGANVDTDLQLRFRYDNSGSNLLRRSDHWPFLVSGVPALFVHTGLHPDYHTPRDRPDTLDYEKMARIVRLVHQLSWNLAQDPARPAFN